MDRYRNATALVVRKVQDGAGPPSTFALDVCGCGGMNRRIGARSEK